MINITAFYIRKQTNIISIKIWEIQSYLKMNIQWNDMIGNLFQFYMQNSELTQLYTVYTSEYLFEFLWWRRMNQTKKTFQPLTLTFSIKKSENLKAFFFSHTLLTLTLHKCQKYFAVKKECYLKEFQFSYVRNWIKFPSNYTHTKWYCSMYIEVPKLLRLSTHHSQNLLELLEYLW